MRNLVDIDVQILRNDVQLPTYAHDDDSGMDVRAYAYNYTDDLDTTYDLEDNEPFYLKPLGRILIKTGLAMAIPDGYEIQVRDRSGCALKAGIMVVNGIGTIDAGYRNEIGVILFNSDTTNGFVINKGDRIAQFVLQEVPKAKLNLKDSLNDTERGTGGFGSSGVK